MGPKEKYNIIVNKIEELVQGECIDGIIMGMDELEICEKAFDAAQSIMDIRSQNILFGFLPLSSNICTSLVGTNPLAYNSSLV